MSKQELFIGVDVGSSSVRAALVKSDGCIITTATQNIVVWEPETNFYEQSSDEIWQAVCCCIKSVTDGVEKECIKGIGFDATCSLVVLDRNFQPLSVCPTGDSRWNVIMWMDHRASDQAAFINKTKHKVLQYVGGVMSLEAEVPKLLWLKQNLHCCWSNAGHFIELPDFLTWRATGSLSRSLCSLVCKMTYLSSSEGNEGWAEDFFMSIGLEDLAEDKFQKLGTVALEPGSPCGDGLSPSAAAELGLCEGIPVATSIIDAHAGAIGTLGCTPSLDIAPKLSSRIGLICGTSSCHMKVSESPVFVEGVWGPYYSVLVPGLWCNEGGQSATGKLLDHVVSNHPAYPWIKEEADQKGKHPHEVLNGVLEFMIKKDENSGICISQLTKDVHVWPDYHGNRSPVADPSLKGMVCGLSLSTDVENLAVMYLATMQSLAHGTRLILDAMEKAGHQTTELIVACGGLSKNPLFIQTHADATGVPVALPEVSESVLLGSAMLAARAAGKFPCIQEAMFGMGSTGKVVMPDENLKSYYQRKYAVFKKMLEHQIDYRNMMAE